MDELKPCPFCGGEATIKDHRTIWVVNCTNCDAVMLGERAPEPETEMPDDYWLYFEETAIKAWNTRK